MKSHTLILTSPKIVIPEIKIIEFIKELILSNLLNVDYFGAELDMQADHIDEEMTAKNKTSTFLTFHFKDNDIDYSNYSEVAIFQLIYNKLDSKNIGQVVVDEKGIEVYIN